ncbi:hypothetical protein SAMN05518669_103428 [Variovorax sp. YR634]|uniref:hypothetical protein n=1 Tax=Variovorax sp. YR634 TaxID=1884385 RepID=UPI0008969377|nr:hypothetical protein [Variovorax sp. YR634]SDX15856.1 hypothetical protein SAMN05518669_103428 [Variovorax sp. YR634]
MTDKKKMISQADAELLARKVLQQFVNDCHCQSEQDIANVLMKACSVAGVMMVATVGQNEAFDRLYGTAAFIAQQNFGTFKKEKLQ